MGARCCLGQPISGSRALISIPAAVDPLEQFVSQDLTSLFDGVESAREAGLARRGPARYETFTNEQIWTVVQKLRAQDTDESISPQELKLPEWRLFSKPDPARNNRDLKLRVVPPPARYRRWIEQVVLVEKLREVRRLEAGWRRFSVTVGAASSNQPRLGSGRGGAGRRSFPASFRASHIGLGKAMRNTRGPIHRRPPPMAASAKS